MGRRWNPPTELRLDSSLRRMPVNTTATKTRIVPIRSTIARASSRPRTLCKTEVLASRLTTSEVATNGGSPKNPNAVQSLWVRHSVASVTHPPSRLNQSRTRMVNADDAKTETRIIIINTTGVISIVLRDVDPGLLG